MRTIKKNILIHAINGIGLGHIRRTVLIAKALIRYEEIGNIIFVSNTSHPFIIHNAGFETEKLEYGIEDTLRDIPFDTYDRENFERIHDLVEQNHIDIIIHDTYFIKSIVSERRDVRHFLILRDSDLKTIAAYFPFFKKIFIPHIPEEFSQEKRTFFSGFDNIIFVWYVAEKAQGRVAKTQTIIVSPGYGGDFENTKNFFIYTHALLLSNNRLLGWYETTFVLGKHAERLRREIAFHPSFVLSDLREDFLGHLRSSALLIGRGGYNTLNEIVLSATKGLLFVAERFSEKQESRVDFFIRHFAYHPIEKGIFDMEADSEKLRKLLTSDCREDIDYGVVFCGADRIAAEIRKESSKPNILLFKHIFLPKSENFILEELSWLDAITPIIFTLKIENEAVFPDTLRVMHHPAFQDLLDTGYPQIYDSGLYVKFLQCLSEIIKKYHIKVIYTEFLSDAYFVCKIKHICKDVRIVSAARGFDVYDFLERDVTNRAGFFQNLDGIFARDRTMQEKIRDFWYKSVQVVRSVVDFEKYTFEEKNFDMLDICIWGRFTPKKNLWELLDLIARLHTRWIVRSIGVVWDAGLSPEILQRIHDLKMGGHIKIHGFLPHGDLQKVLKSYNTFICYSKKIIGGDDEGIPNLILENILSGNLVFSTLTGWIGEIFDPDAPNVLRGDGAEDTLRIEWWFSDKIGIRTVIQKDYKKIREVFKRENALGKLQNLLLQQDE